MDVFSRITWIKQWITKSWLSIVILLISYTSFSQQHTFEFAKTFTGQAYGYGNAVSTDQQGAVFLTGVFSGTIDMDPGVGVYTLAANSNNSDCYFAKITAQGNLAWAANFGSSANIATSGNGLKTDYVGNVYLVGSFGGTVDFDFSNATNNLVSPIGQSVFLCKYTGLGNLVWAKALGGGVPSSSGRVALDANGNIFASGTFSGVCDFDPGPNTFTLNSNGTSSNFIVKLNSAGNFVWAKKVAFGGNLTCSQNNGDLIINGNFQGSTDFDPGPSTSILNSNGQTDGYVCRLSSNGNFIWAVQFGGNGYDGVAQIVMDPADNIYATGGFQGTCDFDPSNAVYNLIASGGQDAYVVKLNSAGGFVFVKQFMSSGTGFVGADGISLDANGSIYVSSSFNVVTDFDPGIASYTYSPVGTVDGYLLKLDALGNFNWAMQFAGAGLKNFSTHTMDGAGSVFLTGYFRGTCDFDPGPTTQTINTIAVTDYDPFLLKLSLCADSPQNLSNYYVCSGANATLSAYSSSSINWYNSISATVPIGTGSIHVATGLALGNYTYYAAANSCTTNGIRTPVIISVVSLPPLTTAANPSTVCAGISTTLLAGGASSYTWQSAILTATLIVTPSVTTVFTAIAKDSITGCFAAANQSVIVNPLPNILISPTQPTICAKEKIVFIGSGSGTYTWSNGSQSNSITVTASTTANYTVHGTNTLTSCTGNQTVLLTVNPCLSIAEPPLNETFKVFPNPVEDILTIHSGGPGTVILYDAFGAKVNTVNVYENTITIDFSPLASGAYFIEIITSSANKRFKIVKV